MSRMSKNFRLSHLSNLSVRNFRFVMLMYPGSPTGQARGRRAAPITPGAAESDGSCIDLSPALITAHSARPDDPLRFARHLDERLGGRRE